MTSVAAPASARGGGRLAVLLTIAALLCALLVGLGVWQLQRLSWKLDLIRQVDARVHAAPVPAPGPSAWPSLTAGRDAYRHVRVRGRFLAGRDTLVQAATVLGSGFWVMSPLKTPQGYVVLINRGFVPAERPAIAAPAAGDVQVQGLLRLTEPHGGFLRANDPPDGRWYSRDVGAIAAARGLGPAAPYFVDAAADPGAPAGAPVGGLTVVAFANNHLVYALTWFTLALMVAGAATLVVREDRRVRRGGDPA